MPRACQHLFCSSCLYRALDLSPTCPIDRTRVKNRREDLVEAPRVIHELLGELKVKCTACRDEVTREGWDRHVSKCRGSGRQRAVEEAQEGIALPAHGDSSVPGSGENETQCEICEEGVLERDWNVSAEYCALHEFRVTADDAAAPIGSCRVVLQTLATVPLLLGAVPDSFPRRPHPRNLSSRSDPLSTRRVRLSLRWPP